jgi:hypothetical protein
MTSSDAAAIASAVGCRAGICAIAVPSPIECVCPASQPSTLTTSEPHASPTQIESYPQASASCATATCSSGPGPTPQ